MSRSRKSTGAQNPAAKTMEWKGGSDSGHWKYWDKDAQTEVAVKGLRFLVLDELSSVSGWAEQYNGSGFSNEVHSTNNEPLVVRVFVGKGKTKVVAEGLYADIKGNLPAGLKYTKVIYAYDIDNKETIRLLLKGAALSAWINSELDKQYIVEQTEYADGKKGAIKDLQDGLSKMQPEKAREVCSRIWSLTGETGFEEALSDELNHPVTDDENLPF